jgi:hypothetical protein
MKTENTRIFLLLASLCLFAGMGSAVQYAVLQHSDAQEPPEPKLEVSMEMICDNGLDDDQDGNADCYDEDCYGSPSCMEDGNCTDGIDNDMDGSTDCDDDDCSAEPACEPPDEICDNGLDDDQDGNADCYDEDCYGSPSCGDEGQEEQEGEEQDFCGNGICSNNELCNSCPQDCGACPPRCGDWACNGNETCPIVDQSGAMTPAKPGKSICTADCGSACPPVCGNTICERNEICPSDCPNQKPKTIQQGCGNGTCDEGESRAACPEDCLFVPPLCGDRVCVPPEQYSNCPLDCPLIPVGETKSQVLTEKAICGDGRCSGNESCMSCDGDCGSCFLDRVLRGVSDMEEELTIDRVQQTSSRLVQSLERDTAIKKLLGEDTIRDLQMLRELKADRNRMFSVSEAVSLSKLVNRVTNAMATESNSVRALLQREIFPNEHVQRELSTTPGLEEINAAVHAGDLRAMRNLLLTPRADVYVLDRDLSAYENIYHFLLESDEEKFVQRYPRIPKTFAAPEKDTPFNAKERLRESAFLMMRMRQMAADPDAVLPDLEERLEYLTKRKHAIAGVIGIPEENMDENVERMEDGLQSPAPKKLLNIVGMFNFLSLTPNFQKLELTFERATSGMRSGIGTIRSYFAWGSAPEAEAASFLAEKGRSYAVNALQTEHIELQKLALRIVVEEQKGEMQVLFLHLPEDDRIIFEDRLEQWMQKFETAGSPTLLRIAMHELGLIVYEAENAARSRSNIFLRLGYAIQDFFGVTT